MKKILGSLFGLWLVLAASIAPAFAQTEFVTPNGPVAGSVGSVVIMCLDSSGQAVPYNQSGNCPGGSSGGAVTLGVGSVVAGAYLSGSILDGAIVTLGLESDTGSCAVGHSVIACLRQQDADIQAGSAPTGSAVPSAAVYLGVNVGGNLTGFAPGTAGTPSTQVISVQGENSMTPFLVNPGTAANFGVGATGSAVPANGILSGCRATNTEQAAGSDGNLQSEVCGLGGKLVSLPYAVKEMSALGAGNTTGTGALTIIAANASLKTYVTDVECGRDDAGTTAVTITFNDSKSSQMVVPNNGGGGGNNMHFSVPLVTSAINTAFTATPGAGVTTMRCNAQGYYAN